jgi:hypothetical protein
MARSRRDETRTPRAALFWIFLGLAAWLLFLRLSSAPGFVERFFSRGLFVGFRWAWDFTLGLSPLPLVYIAVPLLAVFVFRGLAGWIRGGKPDPYRPRTRPSFLRRAGKGFLRLLALAGGTVFLFYMFWGFNYARTPIDTALGLETGPLSGREVRAEAAAGIRELTEARAAIPGLGPEAVTVGFIPENLEGLIRDALQRVLLSLEYAAPGKPRVRRFRPGSWLMRFDVSGMYVPFLGEGYVADGLTPPEIPFSMAHEMAHAFGFAEEGAAQFLAWLACEAAEDPVVRYSGRLAFWAVLSSALRRVDPDEHRLQWVRLPDGARADLRAVFLNWNRFRGRLSEVGRRVNDRYLKAQGVREGVLSYDRLLVLVHAWRLSGRMLPSPAKPPARVNSGRARR